MAKLLCILVCVILASSSVDCFEYAIAIEFEQIDFEPINATLYLLVQTKDTVVKLLMNNGIT